MGPISRHLLADAVTAIELRQLVGNLIGRPVSRHALRKLIKRGKVPAPVGVIGRSRLWSRQQLATLRETIQ